MTRRVLAFAAAALLLSSCRTAGKLVKGTVKTTAKVAYGTVKIATKTAVGVVGVAGGLVKDFAYYAARAAFYKKNHDSARAGQLCVTGRRW